jgi:hypothetical protein
MEQVLIGNDRYTQVFSLDEKGNGNANHKYSVSSTNEPSTIFATVNFQDGAILEAGINGCHNEDLIAIVIHRLQGFQDGAWKCRENALAITKLEEALQWLNYRTTSRQKRGVEGTHSI